MKHLLALGLAACLLPDLAKSEPVEFRYGFDVFEETQGTLDAFHSLSAMRELSPGLHFGQTLYSAAAGDAGGLFVGGFELAKRWRLGSGTELELGGFLGGGGGAALVGGDGLMLRGHVTLHRHLFGEITGMLGVSYIDISGSPISTPALSFGIRRDTNFALTRGHNGSNPGQGRVVTAIKPLVKQFYPQDNLQRSGTPLGTMTLLGFEASFASSPRALSETFLQATGAVAGDGEGYADVQAGYRWKTAPDGLRAFAEIAAGFAGGGDVDTGGGLIASIGAGAAVPVTRGLELEFGAQATAALDGDLLAISPYLRASLTFGDRKRPYADKRDWQLSLGFTHQSANDAFRNSGVTATASPLLAETGLDLFLGDHLYFTGNAQTVVDGDAGGYAVGLFGLGYAMPINDRWTVSLEGHLGAAGGGGVDTGGGLVGAARVELDYSLSDTLAISAGLGRLQSLRGGGARPVTLHLGFKTRFSTFQ